VDAAVKETLLDQFRSYLDSLEEAQGEPDEPGAEADLFTVFVELAALRNEVRTESRLVKEALDQFRGVFATLQSSHATLEQELKRVQAEARERGRAQLRPLLLELLDLRDRLVGKPVNLALRRDASQLRTGCYGGAIRHNKPPSDQSDELDRRVNRAKLTRPALEPRILRIDIVNIERASPPETDAFRRDRT
jgi:hypothetical protein